MYNKQENTKEPNHELAATLKAYCIVFYIFLYFHQYFSVSRSRIYHRSK